MTRLPAEILRDQRLVAVLDAIEADGHRAYLVGGAVRNALLGEPVADIDISTDARPQEIIRLAEAAGLKPVPTGIDHGTITIVSGGEGFEVTTFRHDVETDGRRAVVTFSDNLEADAQRRDFTMNALYADRTGRVIDPVGGLADLAERRLRFVGGAEQRIREDYLRILRFFRFLAWYGRQAEPEAIRACASLRDGLSCIAKERIGAEVKKLLAARNPAYAVHLMVETGILPDLLPGADATHLHDLIAVEGDTSPAWPRRLALLAASDPADALRLSRDEAKTQASLQTAQTAKWSLDEAAYRLNADAATDLALIRAARGENLPTDWRARIVRAASARLPIAASDLMPTLLGPQISRGLKAAENLWIAGGFATPTAALIETALQAGGDA
jgi:poly(A) polymerase